MAFNNEKTREVMNQNFDYEVSGVRVLSDNVAVFNLKLCKGLTLYGLRLIDGKNGMFIVPAQTSYRDRLGETKYSNNYYIGLSDTDQKKIIDMVVGKMN